MKRNPEMGETAMQPVPAQTADLSISGLCFMSSPCIPTLPLYHEGFCCGKPSPAPTYSWASSATHRISPSTAAAGARRAQPPSPEFSCIVLNLNILFQMYKCCLAHSLSL